MYRFHKYIFPCLLLCLALLLPGGILRAAAVPCETAVVAPEGAVFEAADGTTGVIPCGETVIATYADSTNGTAYIRFRDLEATVQTDALAPSAWMEDVCVKLVDPPTIRILQEDGVPMTAHPNRDADQIGRIPCGAEVTPIYVQEGEAYHNVYVEYEGQKGWIWFGPCSMTAEVRTKEGYAGEITVLEDGLRLMDYSDENTPKPVSAVIPKGTTLPYLYYRDVYYEGGSTSYYLEYQGVRGWLRAYEAYMETPTVSHATLDEPGYVMALDEADCALYRGPFRTGGRAGARLEPHVPVRFDSVAERWIDRETGKILTTEDPYPYNREAEFLYTCRVNVNGVVGWVTVSNRQTGYVSLKRPDVVTLRETPVYADERLQGDPVFTLPQWTFAECFFFSYDQQANKESLFVRFQGRTGWITSDAVEWDAFAKYCTALSELSVSETIGSKQTAFTIPAGEEFVKYDYHNYRDKTDPINSCAFVKYGDAAGWIDANANFIGSGEFDPAKQFGRSADVIRPVPVTQTQPVTQIAPAKQRRRMSGPVVVAAAAGGAVLAAGAVLVLVRKRRKRAG